MDELNQNQPVPETENEYDWYVEAKPWPRFLARLLDYLFFMVLLFTLIDKILKIKLDFFDSLILYFATIFLWCFFETVLLSLLGTTPGKWLLNISVRDRTGGKPAFSKALKRSLLVWLCGTWMGIPIFFILGFVLSYCRLTTVKNTIWDEKSGCRINHNYLQIVKTIAVIALYAVSAYLLIIRPSGKYVVENTQLSYNAFNLYGNSSANDTLGLNQRGLDLINEGKNEEAKKLLLKGLQNSPSDYVRDSIYNNLCLACYNLGEYSAALDYIEKGLKIQANSCEEYINYGNVLLELGRTKEAEDAYNSSLEIDDQKNSSYALYGLGTIKYSNGEYGKAVEYFKKYVSLRKNDADGWCYLGLSYMYGEKDMSKARENLEKALEIDPTDSTAIDCMAEYYNYINDSNKTEDLYINALAKKPYDYELLCSTGEYYSDREDYDKAIEYSDRAIAVDAHRYEAYRAKAKAYLWKAQEDKAVETANTMIVNNAGSVIACNAAGELFSQAYNYKLAGQYYDRAMSIDPSNVTACVGKIGSLYYRKRYTQCLEFALKSAEKFENTDILWYAADAYSALKDSEKAIEYYKKALDTDTDNAALNIGLGWEYYYSEKYTDAGRYVDKALEIDNSDPNAKNLKESIGKRQRDLPEQVGEFIESNYMYYKPNTDYEKLKSSLTSGKTASGAELASLFETVHLKDDIFSFVLYGDEYRRYREMGSGITTEYRLYGEKIHYVRINNFTETTSNEFLDIVDNIADPQDQYLVVDLRGNGGGYTDSGCSILDFLLPDCVVCNIIFKDGYSDSYYSDDENIQFRHIFVLVDENTASCSELVTLGLKTYLDDVTVIGRKTFGKGVGQAVLIDETREIAVFAVNHYWNVRETNIMDKGIKPDIMVRGDSTDAFMDEVFRYIGAR